MASERFEIRIDQELLERIDTHRASLPDVPNRAEVVRRLVAAGLNGESSEGPFQLMRLTVLESAYRRTEEAGDHSHLLAYAYAWNHSVYPMFHDTAEFHKPVAEFFHVTERMMEELSSYLDEMWNAGSTVTFYGLEDRYKVRRGASGWTRIAMLRGCRYMHLMDMFDEDFWGRLLTPGEHPAEASSVLRPFEKGDIYPF